MNEEQISKRKVLLSKIVSNARAILSNQVAIPLGVEKMNRLIDMIDHIEPVSELDLSVFRAYANEANGLAIGTERLQYNLKFLLSEDQVLDSITSKYKEEILEKCFSIIGHFAI